MRSFILLTFVSVFLFSNMPHSYASETKQDEVQINKRRMELFHHMESVTHIPWYYFAGIDQYERSTRRARKDLPKERGAISIYYEDEKWSGPLNPTRQDTNPITIALFGGLGKDGNGDGKADINDDEDLLFTIANYLQTFGVTHAQIKIGIWDYYKRSRTVDAVLGNAKLFKTYGRLDLQEKAFPVPIRSNHSYRSTWGDARGWGGRRVHEGTDIFADYGVPVRATCYGVLEIKGWNRYGGWRIGIRDINNTYHYLAHLSGFSKGLQVGQIVEPGMIIGGVGSSGYGPPGTSGKFPPHLHYGMYKDNGRIEWSFDPYPHLRNWERLDRMKLNKKK
ncbi:murein DD-endopeptidase MepM/ murein hydrolase activator NlpD [Bacillus iocasae]|uniref:Murein DD-endopeptidase MepM/ murein hydrolase activator NlpD n=2 Tax=Priestia iocasae TaxID=2291674 RepID=A0ABS2QYM0_9BACI|nr:M23 family metallopeptidase [Metabacillus iocasae]MBM7704593.1 murein DD-endopeptidase MepM/ murein hydrolase activator NlpD [Metabacillus iocasae]